MIDEVELPHSRVAKNHTQTGVYHSSEDSALLRVAIRGYRGRSCLELGFGSGSNLPQLCDQFEVVAATDILRPEPDPEGLPCVELVIADRATCFRDSSFDFVVFNPPYLPSETIDDPTVDGGKGGIEIPVSFLEEAVRVVRTSGTILFLLSSEGNLDEFAENCARLGVQTKLIRKKKMFYETLFVYEGLRLGYEHYQQQDS